MTMEITTNTIISRPDDILFSKIDDEVVMMGIDSGKYYGLNPIGSKIWELIDRPVSINELCCALMDEYDVEEETCRKETIELIKKMVENKLINIK